MSTLDRPRPARAAGPWWQVTALLLATLAATAALVVMGEVPAPPNGSAQRLSALHATLAPRLGTQQPVIESSDGPQRVRGDVYALLPQDWPVVAAALRQPAQWCEALLLHVYVKRCTPGAGMLTLHVVTRPDTPPERAQELPLAFDVGTGAPGYLRVSLAAEHGPMGLRDVEFLFEAIPGGPGTSFVHFGYQAGASTVGTWAMQAYLSTFGRNKVGFSAAADGQPPGTVRGTRGVAERNAMRYHLAIATYLDSLALPEAERTEYRIGAWFDATERYPRQLHETERAGYLAMKRRELPAPARPPAP
jgi:hypothetical protein